MLQLGVLEILRPSGSCGEPQAPGRGALTPRAVTMGVHEAQAQALILLQGALVREAPVHSAHHVCLLLAVVDRGLGHVHWLPAGGATGHTGARWYWTVDCGG